MNQLRQPKDLSSGKDWTRWKSVFNLYMIGSGAIKLKEEEKIAILLHCIGDEGRTVSETFEFTEKDRTYDTLIKKFDEYYVPALNESVETFKFNSRVQGADETFEKFETDLRQLSNNCNFGLLRDRLIRDRIVAGVKCKIVQDRLLRTPNLILSKACEIAKSAEQTMEQAAAINNGQATEVQAVFQHQKTNKKEQKQSICGKCGKIHNFKECPAYGKQCHTCKGNNHFSNMCFKKINNGNPAYVKNRYVRNNKNNSIKNSKKVYEMKEDEVLFLGNINVESILDRGWFINCMIENQEIHFKIDSGAQVNVLPNHVYMKFDNKQMIEKIKINLSNYNGSYIKVLGKSKLKCHFENGMVEYIDFIVVDEQSQPIIGFETMIKLNLVKKLYEVNANIMDDPKYKSISEGIGLMKVEEYDFKIQPGAVGNITYTSRVPFTVIDELKRELESMVNNDIIIKEEEPTEWVNPIVVVKNKNKMGIRICLDPFHLNKVLLREHFNLPTFEEISSKFSGAKLFTVLDASKGFWQLPLTLKSSKLTTFITPFGRYRFKRLPFGIKIAPEVFHKTFSRVFADIKNVFVYIDDLIIIAKSKEEHDDILRKVLDKALSVGIKFNREKSQIAVNEVKFLGHIFSVKGIQIDKSKIKAIENMVEPKNKKDLERFLGMMTYVQKFVPNMSQLAVPLRELLKKDCNWYWGETQIKAFNVLKCALTSEPLLQYFDLNKKCTLSVDASKDGLGAVLLQNDYPVAYASKTLNDTQKQYAQIEKELLAILYGCERFKQYIYGKNINIESDHKPLETIFKKPLDKTPARLQRMRIKLMAYDLNIIYKPGKFLKIADTLSRAHIKDNIDLCESEIELQVNMIIKKLNISENKLRQFKEEFKKDTEFQMLLEFVKHGWPSINNIPDQIKKYLTFSEELFEKDGLLFKGQCLMVPKTLRKEMLDKIHYTHMSIEKCKSKARECLFWPEMTKEITDKINKCSICQSFRKNNSKEPMTVRDFGDNPWEIVGTDIFQYQNRQYLLIIDYFSKYVDIEILEDMSSETTINKLKLIFSRYGIPLVLFSDNGPQFSNSNFKNFSKEWDFEHKTSSPRYPQSNGMAERNIQTVKNIFKKVVADKKDIYLAMLELKNTPILNENYTPNEIMFNRNVRGIVPKIWTRKINYNSVKKAITSKQKIDKKQYDKNAKKLIPIKEGYHVFVNMDNRKPYIHGKVISVCKRPNSFVIKLSNGQTVERNRKHLIWDPGYDYGDSSESEKELVKENQNKSEKELIKGNQNKSKKEIVKGTQTKSGRVIKKPKHLEEYI
ncbi:unnamed protein product [Macrosiphum euphorbiae]|uniref:RNA-directed DNA polymerase n=1 Tax=Macrosiphum euphorbiae TaxID=13131 RepID=A0AAV0YAU9_9HEMI|nr:unnamed protein product [Macrosiphum euphorbiae]CAI6376391.1 unnamed protein product [Macrosiphum euphorbiae]